MGMLIHRHLSACVVEEPVESQKEQPKAETKEAPKKKKSTKKAE